MHPHNLPERASRRRNTIRQSVQKIATVDKREGGAAHVLVVEDDADLRQSMVFVLGDEGYVVSDATDGLHALRLLEEGLRPSLILLDLMMPNMNGFQFREAQLTRAEIAAIPIIAWTAHNDPDGFVEPLRADGVLRKPFDIPDLLGVVKRVIEGKASTNAARGIGRPSSAGSSPPREHPLDKIADGAPAPANSIKNDV